MDYGGSKVERLRQDLEGGYLAMGMESVEGVKGMKGMGGQGKTGLVVDARMRRMKMMMKHWKMSATKGCPYVSSRNLKITNKLGKIATLLKSNNHKMNTTILLLKINDNDYSFTCNIITYDNRNLIMILLISFDGLAMILM